MLPARRDCARQQPKRNWIADHLDSLVIHIGGDYIIRAPILRAVVDDHNFIVFVRDRIGALWVGLPLTRYDEVTTVAFSIQPSFRDGMMLLYSTEESPYSCSTIQSSGTNRVRFGRSR